MNPQNPSDDGEPLNPYSPASSDRLANSIVPAELSDITARGMVGQVQILGVLMIVQGVLISFAGTAIIGYSLLMPRIMQQMQQQAAGQGGNAAPMPPNMSLWIGVVGGLVGLLILAIGAFTIFAGVRTMKFRGRLFSIVVLCTGLLTILTCYCLPTQIALSVYGMIVLLNGPVRDAFRLAEQGHSSREIQLAFMSLP
jgi:hypothetical protein